MKINMALLEGTQPARTKLMEYLIKSKNDKEKCFIAALDINSAYNNVDHQILQKILKKANFPKDFQNYIKKWLNEIVFRIKIGDLLSKNVLYKKGLPQGDPLSPILFNIYVNSIKEIKEKSGHTLMFADDILVIDKTYEAITEKNKKSWKSS